MTDRPVAPFAGAAAPTDGVPAAAWDFRVARAVPFALVCTLIAAAGHAWVGGGDVALPALAAGFTAVLLLAASLGGRERSLGAITGALAAGQLALHVVFHTVTPATGGHHMAGMSMPEAAGRLLCDDVAGNGVTALPAGTSPEQLISAAGLDPHAYAAAGAGHAGGLLGTSPAMLLGHLVAAVAAGWWLRRGEAALWRLLRLTAAAARELAPPLHTLLGLLAALLTGGPVPARPVRPYGGRAEDWRLPVAAVLRHSVVRRGPPAGAFAR
ncbi:hypothetical protein [Kitasatospora sp. NBC_01539]|uniref:hypothetical protein n=1 Tax=Kitasatospora sp. NBC_01539 TaxID=2903577 RepID=UPI0038601559